MRQVRCNYCHQDRTVQVNEGQDLYLDLPERYCLVRCLNCGLIYQNPQLSADELLAHYPIGEYALYQEATNQKDGVFQHLDQQRGMTRRCRQIQAYQSTPGRLLDVGCATGNFMVAMRDRGWQVAGIELNPQAADYGRRTLGLEIETGKLEDIPLLENDFDVVTMWDVFEHVLDPKQTLVIVRRILRPGGLFVAATPNPASLEARLFGDAWAGWDRPRHLYLYSPTVLRRYLHEAGFEEVHIKSFSGRLSVTLLSLEYLVKQRKIPERRWRPWLKAAYNWPFRLLTWPIYRLLEGFNQTTNMTAFAR
jgi:SAM-dependent methyltransferase